MFNISEDIAKAKEILNGKHAPFHIKKPKKGKSAELNDFTIIVAIADVRTRDIPIAKVYPTLGGTSGGIVGQPGKSNGVNTSFTIIYPEHHIVLAVKRPVCQGTTFKEVVYTPYSEGLDIPPVRQAGLEYLHSVLKEAKHDPARRRVTPSGGAYVPNSISLTLAIIEHIDPVKFSSGQCSVEKLSQICR